MHISRYVSVIDTIFFVLLCLYWAIKFMLSFLKHIIKTEKQKFIDEFVDVELTREEE
jgi:hypothetical protein